MANVYAGFLDDMQRAKDIENTQIDLIESLPLDRIASIEFVTKGQTSKSFNEEEFKSLFATELKEYWAISDAMEFSIKGSSTKLSITHAEPAMVKWLCERWAYALITISSIAQVGGTAVTLSSLQQQLDNCDLTQGHNLGQALSHDNDVMQLFNVTSTPTMSPTIDCSSVLVTPQTVNMNLALTALNYVLWNYTQISGPTHKHDLELTNALLAITESFHVHQEKVPPAIATMLTKYSAQAEMATALSKLPTEKEIRRAVRKTIAILTRHVAGAEQVLKEPTSSETEEMKTLRSALAALSATVVSLDDKAEMDQALANIESSNALLEKAKTLLDAITIIKKSSASSNAGQAVTSTPMFTRLSRSLSRTSGALTFFSQAKKPSQEPSVPAPAEEATDESSGLIAGKKLNMKD